MSKTLDLTTGSMFKKLLAFAVPFFIASFLQALYGATDMLVVGRFVGTSALSAVNIGSQFMSILTGFVTGCSMGVTVTLGNFIGAKNNARAARTLGNTITLFTVLAVIITPILVWQSGNLAILLNTPPEAMQETVTYLRICTAAAPFVILFNVSAGVMRGLGNSQVPMYVVVITCVLNIIGDLILTGLFDMGVTGVAIATAGAQLISSVCGIFLIRRSVSLKLTKNDLKTDSAITRQIVCVGLPIALQDSLINMSFLILTAIANGRGLVASSAVGVVEKFMMFLFLVPAALLSAVSAITAQNIGANKPERAVSAMKYGIVICIIFGSVMTLLSWLFPDQLIGIFTRDSSVIEFAGQYLRPYATDCIIAGCIFCMNGYLCGINRSTVTFIHSVIATFAVRIPLAMLFTKLFPASLFPFGLASPLASLFSVVFLLCYLAYHKRRGTLLSAV